MLSQKAKYALKALVLLALQDEGNTLQCSEIAKREALPKKFLDNILQALKTANIVQSERGKYGGYQLAKPATEISFGQIIRVIDGPLALLPCVSKTAYRRCEDCLDETTCAVRKVMLQVRNSTSGILDNTTLADVLEGKRT
ncbi:MAG: transcriptional regulator, BadM/Rrf2 family [Rickettsiales bacterium]|jgi:Rrf2 family protein|nr:transcriptional regulator, BadM/Rrf2 family [Rickettsiales bacterium]